MRLLDSLRRTLAASAPASEPPVLDDEELGEICAWCLTRDELWINRLVERIQLVDDETIRRQVSIDFTLPAWLADRGTLIYVPLAILRKAPLTNFDVWREDGARVSVLNTAQDASVNAAALATLARRAAHAQGVALADDSPLFGLLEIIAREPAPAAQTASAEIAADFPDLLTVGPFRAAVERLTAPGDGAGPELPPGGRRAAGARHPRRRDPTARAAETTPDDRSRRGEGARAPDPGAGASLGSRAVAIASRPSSSRRAPRFRGARRA